MSFSAIIMMILAIAIVWGGLVFSLWRLPRKPDSRDGGQ